MKTNRLTPLAFILSIALSGCAPVDAIPAIFVQRAKVVDDDYNRLSDALHVFETSKTNVVRDDHLFDSNSSAFRQVFITSTADHDMDSKEARGNSMASLVEDYYSKFGASASTGLSVPVGGAASVNSSLSGKFDTTNKSNISSVAQEYYNFLQVTKKSKYVSADWLNKDLSGCFTKNAVDLYKSATSVGDAIEFLEMYGSHVYKTYTFGGTLNVTRYISSSENINEQVAEKNGSVSLSMEATVQNAKASAESETDFSTKDHTIARAGMTNENIHVWNEGGSSVNGFDYESLFKWRPGINGNGSYNYKDWLDSLEKEDGNDQNIINVSGAIPVWDLMKKTGYGDKNSLFVEAFNTLCYQYYSKDCQAVNIAADYINKISYNAEDYKTEFVVTGASISVPDNASILLDLGDSIKDIIDKPSFDISLRNGSVADFDKEAKVIAVKKGTIGKDFDIVFNYNGAEIYNLKVNIRKGDFDYGYGTEDQPYVLNNSSDFDTFAQATSLYSSGLSFVLGNDIDFEGDVIHSVGENSNGGFYGQFDGNGHSLRNGSIISKTVAPIGLFSKNYGTIKNLNVENVKVINNGLISFSNGDFDCGILVGNNSGSINSCMIKDCALRIASEGGNGSSINIGGIAGKNVSEIKRSVVESSLLTSVSWEGQSSHVNVGPIAGENVGSTISTSYARYNDINCVCSNSSRKPSINLGCLVGHMSYNDTNQQKMQMCLSYGNEHSGVGDSGFGYICGAAEQYDTFELCFFESDVDKAISGKHSSGCTAISSLKLSNIKNSAIASTYVADEYGYPVLSEFQGGM